MMQMREVLEMKIDELAKQHADLIEKCKEGEYPYQYIREESIKICGEIRGMAYALGYDVESKMGLIS